MNIPKTLGPVDLEVNEFLNFCLSRVRILRLAMVVSAWLFSLLCYYQGESVQSAFTPALAVSAFAIFFSWFTRNRTLKNINAIKESLRGLSWTLTDSCLVIQTVRSRTELPWNEQKKCRIQGKMICLHNFGGMRYVFPLRALGPDDDAEKIAAWIQEQITKAKI